MPEDDAGVPSLRLDQPDQVGPLASAEQEQAAYEQSAEPAPAASFQIAFGKYGGLSWVSFAPSSAIALMIIIMSFATLIILMIVGAFANDKSWMIPIGGIIGQALLAAIGFVFGGEVRKSSDQ